MIRMVFARLSESGDLMVVVYQVIDCYYWFLLPESAALDDCIEWDWEADQRLARQCALDALAYYATPPLTPPPHTR